MNSRQLEQWNWKNGHQQTWDCTKGFSKVSPLRIGGCVKSDAERSWKVRGKCTIEVTVGKSCNLVFAAEFHKQPMEFIQQWCYMISLSLSKGYFTEQLQTWRQWRCQQRMRHEVSCPTVWWRRERRNGPGVHSWLGKEDPVVVLWRGHHLSSECLQMVWDPRGLFIILHIKGSLVDQPSFPKELKVQTGLTSYSTILWWCNCNCKPWLGVYCN